MSAGRSDIQDALARLDAITRRLRRECPWDREQDERTIVPHTLEEAYELADAAHRRDDAKLVDELGDVLFQVHFLALLLEERGAGDLAEVADACAEKLVRRHPHVFGSAGEGSEDGSAVERSLESLEGSAGEESPEGSARVDGPLTASDVLRNWDRIKEGEDGRERGIFAEVPENLPSLLYARKLQRRAATSGFDFPGLEVPRQAVRDELEELAHAKTPEERFHELGDVLFAVVNVARKLRSDPELALRAACYRFRDRVKRGSDLATSEGRDWNDLDPDEQLAYYARVRLTEGDDQTR